MLLPSLGCSADPDWAVDPLGGVETFRAVNDPTNLVHLLTLQKALPVLLLVFVQDSAFAACGQLDDVCEGLDDQGAVAGTVCTECTLACTGSRQPDGTWNGAGDCAEKKHAGADTYEHTHHGNAFPKLVIEYDYDIESKEIEQATVGGNVAGASGSDPDLFVERRVVWKYTITYSKVTLWLTAQDPHVLKKPAPLVGELAGCAPRAGQSCGGGTGSSTGSSSGTESSSSSSGSGGSDTENCEWGLETGLIETSTGDSGS